MKFTRACEDFATLGAIYKVPRACWNYCGHGDLEEGTGPTNHSTFFVLAIQPTLQAGTDAMAPAALTFLAKQETLVCIRQEGTWRSGGKPLVGSHAEERWQSFVLGSANQILHPPNSPLQTSFEVLGDTQLLGATSADMYVLCVRSMSIFSVPMNAAAIDFRKHAILGSRGQWGHRLRSLLAGAGGSPAPVSAFTCVWLT